jgi:hypothetical protein
VVAEDDVQRAVAVRRDAARPERAGGQVGRASQRLERDRIDALDPRRDRVAQGAAAEPVPEG